MSIIMVQIGKLSLSDELNVRRTDRAADIESLADSIATRGLKQNLIGVSNGKAGHFEIVAGGRRLQALQLLVTRKTLKASDEVPVLVEERAQGVETSLEENLQRVAMNPADELDAYRTIIAGADGTDADRVAYTAKRFGKPVRYIEQRMRLAALAPEILEALRSDEISLETAKAYASTSDTTRQLEIWNDSGASYNHNPSYLKRLVTQGSVTNADPRAILVGRSAYEAAGGRVESDLFASAATEQWSDVPLLERLAQERMTELGEEIRAKDGFAEVIAITEGYAGYEITKAFDTWYPRPVAMPDSDAGEKFAKLEAEQSAAGEQLEAAGDYATDDEGRPTDVELAKIWDRYEEIDEEIVGLRNGATSFDIPPEKKARFIRILVLGSNGVPKLTDPWYSVEKVDRDGEVVGKSKAAEKAAANGGLSDSLAGELAMQRRDVLAIEIAREPDIALLYAQFAILDGIATRIKAAGTSRRGTALQLNEQDRWEPVPTGQVEGTGTAYAHIRDAQAHQSLAWIRDELDWSWCNGLQEKGYTGAWISLVYRFDRFRALTREAREALFAWAVASSLNASGGEARANRLHDRLAGILAIDVATWWRPTAANYFGRINADGVKAALREMSDGTADISGKKGELARRAESYAAGEGGESQQIRDLAKTWLPDAMRFTPAPVGDDA